MKKMNMGFILVIAIVVAFVVILYKYAYPTQPWLEGYTDVIDNTFINRSRAVASLIFLNKVYKGVDINGVQIEADFSTVASCSSAMVNISKKCYGDMLMKYGIVPETPLPVSPATNLDINQIKATLSNLRTLKGIAEPEITDSMINSITISEPVFCLKTPIGSSEYIKPACYNILLKKLFVDVPASTVTTPVIGSTTTPKEYRVGFFKNISLIAGYTNIKTSQIETVYDKMPSCKKDDAEYDIDCFHELANEFKINISKEAMDSVGISTAPKNNTTAAEKTIEDALKALKDDSVVAAGAKKCTVEFGKKPEIAPQTGAATEKKPDTTCTTTGAVVNDTKTPSMNQGCEFGNKFPKVNVINLRDYVHKDEIPCWSCKL